MVHLVFTFTIRRVQVIVTLSTPVSIVVICIIQIRVINMNEELKKLVIEAGAPVEMLDELWFNVFCQKFADRLIKEVEDLYGDWKE